MKCRVKPDKSPPGCGVTLSGMATIISVILGVLLAAAGGVIAWLLNERKHTRNTHATLTRDLDTARQQVDSYREENAGFKQQLAVAQETQKHVQQQFDQAQKQLREAFATLANDALKQSNEQFLTLARKTFEVEQKDAQAQLDKRQQAIRELVQPVQEALKQYNAKVDTFAQAFNSGAAGLRELMTGVQTQQQVLAGETRNLVTALRRPEVRGNWGELTLRRVVELAGLVSRCDFDEQVSLRSDDGALRPDMVINLPSGRCIVVDAKTPLDAYLQAAEAKDDAERDRQLDRHVRQMETKVSELAGKRYSDQFDRSPDFVVLFIPHDAFLQAAAERKPTLQEAAMGQGVVIATPTTLVALLKAVHAGWREEDVAANARAIQDLAVELHKRLVIATGHLSGVGKSLESAVKSYNQFVGSFESRVLVQARRFEEMNVSGPKELETVKDGEGLPRLPEGGGEPGAGSGV